MAKLTQAQALQWAEALESGEYKQGRESMCVNDRNCCLNVLMLTQGVDNINTPKTTLFAYPADPEYSFIDQDMQRRFIDYNDLDRLTFSQIAEKVREIWRLPPADSASPTSSPVET